jgi:plastocyanin domain-containing protein
VVEHQASFAIDQPVDIAFTPVGKGDIAFACGMNMLKGVIVVE